MLVPFEVLIKYSSLGISEKVSGSELVFKANSKDIDKPWYVVGYPDSIFDGIRVYNSDENSEEFLFELPYVVIFGVIEVKMFGLTESSKLGEELVCKEGVWRGVSEWTIEGKIEGTLLGCIEGFIKYN